ncbi:hypothetical protein CLAIMM_05140 [Cladophialophora immunda]|nr:hypothetical protein CLAIMM_05140 [Cladophialophora immunda]
MRKCHQNNIVVYYLLPHSSHVLQPLDLTYFSPVKSRYRAQIADLARFDDASLVKKTRFLQIYQKASQEGLSVANIKSGWKASGIYPWNPRNAIRSSLVLKDAATAQITPRTPPSRKRKAFEDNVYSTPVNRRIYDDSMDRARQEETISRPLRRFLNKTGKELDRLRWNNQQKDRQIASLKAQLERSKAQR